MKIQQHISLQPYNTFGVEAFADYFAEVNKIDDLRFIYKDSELTKLPILILGGGSNCLFTKDYNGLIVKINLKGITIKEEGESIFVTASAGEVWKDLVLFCVNNGFWGIENLSLIPGTAGAAPIQNIGAYGVEFKDVCHSVEIFDCQSMELKTLNAKDCLFSYRDSIFKHALKGKYIITGITLKLSCYAHPQTSYGTIKHELHHRGINKPTVKDISEIISSIRVEKLPDPSTIGNAGSFFKNPIISAKQFQLLHKEFPHIVFYPHQNNIKLAAGWLIEQCNWKGKICGHTGTWKNQALVLVNHGGASGKEIYDLSTEIIQSVQNKFGVELEREVNIF